LPDALANLGDALLADGKTDRAKEIFSNWLTAIGKRCGQAQTE